MTYYQLFGIPPTASPEQVRGAYRNAVRRFHPDVNKAPNASQVTAQLNEAWAVLGDPRKRAAYDRSITRPQPRPAPPTSRRPPPSYGASADAQGINRCAELWLVRGTASRRRLFGPSRPARLGGLPLRILRPVTL